MYLSAVLTKGVAGVQLTLSDVHAPALAASRATLAANGLQGGGAGERCLLHHQRPASI
ncbi:hypothetical protein [Sodalis-like endosymbiont of Proechinophthirus fluctus]|uniref:hypothetical protein n=1 Tax=Sodalis-like endosymbiont of Proechinophthirus fluctus TaxID=1462730 RepID=UPI0034E96C66